MWSDTKMSKNLRNSKIPWIVVDETGSECDDDFRSDDKNSDFDSDVRRRSSKLKVMNKITRNISVVNVDETNHNDTNESIMSRNTCANNEHEITIDDEDDVEIKLEKILPLKTDSKNISDRNTRVKRVNTVDAASSTKKLALGNAEGKRSMPKSKSTRTLGKMKDDDETWVIDSDESDRRDNGKDEIIKLASRTGDEKEKRKDGQVRKAGKSSSKHEIIIDDEYEDDVKLENQGKFKSRRKKTSDDNFTAKKAKTVEPTSSIEDSVVTTSSQSRGRRSGRAAGKTEDANKMCIIDSDESDHGVSGKDGKGKNGITEKKRRRDPERKEEISSVRDLTCEITIDDTDAEDIKLETNIPGKSTKRKSSNERRIAPKKMKVTEPLSENKFTDSLSTEKNLFLKDQITISDEDEDKEDVRPESKVRVETTRKKQPTAEKTVAKKEKQVKDLKLKQKLEKKIMGDENLHAVESSSSEKQSKNTKDNSNFNKDGEWTEAEYLSEFNQIDSQIAENLVSLFKNDNTIPFIARYRKEMTGGMEPEQLRSIKNTYDNIKTIKQRGLLILKTIDKLGKWTPEIYSDVTAAKTLTELELIYAPFKPGTKGSLAERARELGLALVCENILTGRAVPDLSTLVDRDKDGLKNENEIRQGIIHIIADIISKDRTTFEGIRALRKTIVIGIESSKSKVANSSKTTSKEKSNTDVHKYDNYLNFTSTERSIKDYQILAINRGESQKILSVKVIIPEKFQSSLRDYCLRKYHFVRKVSNFHVGILEESFNDAYNRLIKRLISRQVRHDLNAKAESASIEVFARNLKKLLLTPPLRGRTILGIDPGFTHGCKLAIISHCGNVLDTATIYPHKTSRSNIKSQVEVLVRLVKKHNCTIVALGNATACRETETFLTKLIQDGVFSPLDMSYTIVNEAGASIYSCSSEAKAEFPNLDPNIISAISIARRLQDPLAELIKVDPKHLGIGMYQHDLPKKHLQLTLDEVISETVSFVGVDINTASHCLLTKVAGLNSSRATNILELRNKCGFISNRKQLLDVKGVGKKSFEQCAGFIRILPETILTGNNPNRKESCLEYLDQTWIHPESYDVAKQFLRFCHCDMTKLGTDDVINKVLSYSSKGCEQLAKEFNLSKTSMEIIIKGLLMKKGDDIRVEEDAPLFQKNLRCIDDLCPNTKVTGSVRNVTNFGAFVDIGVGKAGLVYLENMKGQVLSLGQRVEVTVLSVDKDRGRISLSL